MKIRNILLGIISWTSFVMLTLFALAGLPSASSLILAAAALVCLPLRPVSSFVKKILPSRALRVIVVVVLFIAGMLMFPASGVETQPEETETVPADTETVAQDQNAVDTIAETEAKAAEPEPVPEPTPKSDEEIRAEYIAACETIIYKDVERNPSEFEGRQIAVTGEVIQVSEGWFNSVTLRIKNDDGTWYATYTRKDDEPRILENDILVVYGECNGVKTYSTVLGAKMTIPALEIKYYDLIMD